MADAAMGMSYTVHVTLTGALRAIGAAHTAIAAIRRITGGCHMADGADRPLRERLIMFDKPASQI